MRWRQPIHSFCADARARADLCIGGRTLPTDARDGAGVYRTDGYSADGEALLEFCAHGSAHDARRGGGNSLFRYTRHPIGTLRMGILRQQR